MSLVSRVLSGAAAAGAACAAAGVTVVALSFALYAFAKDYVGAAGASAIVAGVMAALLGVGFLIASSGSKGPKPKAHGHAKSPARGHDPQSLMERMLDTARERPLIAAAGAVAAGLLALRNPALVATVLGLINQPKPPRRD